MIRSQNTTKLTCVASAFNLAAPGLRHCKTAKELNVPAEIILARKGSFETQNVFLGYFLHIHVHEMTLLQINPLHEQAFQTQRLLQAKNASTQAFVYKCFLTHRDVQNSVYAPFPVCQEKQQLLFVISVCVRQKNILYQKFFWIAF